MVRALLNVSRYLQHAFHVGEYVIRQAEADFRMQIFEILNDRGVELTKIDRIRAAVVNAFYDPEDGDNYIRKWESIVSEFGGDDGRIDDYLSVYLTTVDADVDTIGDASDELTNAFDTRKLDGKATPRLEDPEDAKEFISRQMSWLDITNRSQTPISTEATCSSRRINKRSRRYSSG